MIQQAEVVTHPDLPGISIFPMQGKLQKGKPQQVLVVMRPFSKIPLHRHSVDASMFVVSGSARLLSDDQSNGKYVTPGSVILFGRERDHGFEADDQGMSFVSTNGGIADGNGNWDITMKGGE